LVYQTLFVVKDKCLAWGKKFEIRFDLRQGGSYVETRRIHFDWRAFGKCGRLSGNDPGTAKGKSKPMYMQDPAKSASIPG
jgi:hypothetical protein